METKVVPPQIPCLLVLNTSLLVLNTSLFSPQHASSDPVSKSLSPQQCHIFYVIQIPAAFYAVPLCTWRDSGGDGTESYGLMYQAV